MPAGAIDYTTLTTGLQTAVEGGVTQALPVAGALMAIFLVIRTIRKVVKA